MSEKLLSEFAKEAVLRLSREDPVLYDLLEQEYHRQHETLSMVASCSPADPSVLACEGMFASNVTAEGYPGARYHAGCKFVDQFEQLAIDRVKEAFGAKYANVQPHTATTANQIVTSRLLDPGDTLLGMELDAGGHLTHGSKVNFSGTYFNAFGYGLTEDGQIDYPQIERLAEEHRPKLIICGTTAYPRIIDFERFRKIADSIGAYVLADITHIAGLVIAGEHPNPIDHAHFTVTCTHKQLYGPRGGLIMIGKDWEMENPRGKGTLCDMVQRGLFPYYQGAPIVNKIVAKARALAAAMTPEFTALMKRIVVLSRALAKNFTDHGVNVISGGSDNHIVLADVLSSFQVTGIVAQMALEECGVIVNKNRIPGDEKSVFVSSGIRIGTNGVAARGFDAETMSECTDLIGRILTAVKGTGDKTYELDPGKRDAFREEAKALCRRFPIPGYPLNGR